MGHRLLSVLAVLFAATLPQAISAAAQEAEAEDEPESRFSGSSRPTSANAYFFRGILQERDGLVAQPWGEIYYNVYSSETGFIRDVTIGGGVWASFHTEETLRRSSPKRLYEIDWYPIVYVEFPPGSA